MDHFRQMHNMEILLLGVSLTLKQLQNTRLDDTCSVGSWVLFSSQLNNHHGRWKSVWHDSDRNDVHVLKFYSRYI